MTSQNYDKLAQIVLCKGIRLVCVQYPFRSYQPLQEMLRSRTGIMFIENKENFLSALEKESYDFYFSDRFAGDFGHLTSEGNKVLARNIAMHVLNSLGGFNLTELAFHVGEKMPSDKESEVRFQPRSKNI